ncbi:hypothetical protein ACYOEI_41155, partial [Singulisphaera rosea]
TRTLVEGGPDDAHRLAWIWCCVLSRAPSPDERAVLSALLSKHQAEFVADRQAARKLLGVGELPMANDLDTALLAAWTSVARTVLNLDETITRD